ncbi:hypothetical protein ACELLULO517_09235 [Acidisoma cellulosilytica]|uniref:Uncharacterized protein n=1 Tax=Acidisoma cellulosilyticum TaxID=2802395 RepID=A0A963Z0E9_9PROT|nr:hypothetical protein [Acidisoma cellulosilyticum]MCB8880414.1 hypothetical protein [Acidisoma cellulosilyticum]
MSDIESIGISLVLENGVGEGLRRLQQDLTLFDRATAERAARMQKLAAVHLPGLNLAPIAERRIQVTAAPRQVTARPVAPARDTDRRAWLPPPIRPVRPPVTPWPAKPAASQPPQRPIADRATPPLQSVPVAARPAVARPQPNPGLAPAKAKAAPPAVAATASPASPKVVAPRQRPQIAVTLSSAPVAQSKVSPVVPPIASPPPRARPSPQSVADSTMKPIPAAQPAAAPAAPVEKARLAARPTVVASIPPTPTLTPPVLRQTDGVVPPARLPIPAPRPTPVIAVTATAPKSSPLAASPRPQILPPIAAAPVQRPDQPEPSPERPRLTPPPILAARIATSWPAPRAAVLPSPPLGKSPVPIASVGRQLAVPTPSPTEPDKAPPTAALPPDPQSAEAATLRGDIMIDGIQMGRWLAESMARQAARPPTAARRFNTRMAPSWPGYTN